MTNQNHNSHTVKNRYQDACLSKIEFHPDLAERIVNWIKNPSGMLVYIGNPGVGKTYFCAAVYNSMPSNKKPIYRTENQLLSQVRGVIGEKGGDYSHEVEKMANYTTPFWILDDLGSSQMTEWQKEVLLLFVDELYQQRKPIIITSNIWIKDMAQHFTPRFKSRIAAKENLVFELNWDDKRELGL